MNSIVYVIGAVVIIGVVLKMVGVLLGSGSVPNGAELRRATVPRR